MRLLSLNKLAKHNHRTVQVGRTILDEKGMVLVGKGVELTPFLTARLQQLGITHAYVDDGVADDINVPEPISQETMMRTISFIHTTMKEITKPSNVASFFHSPKFTKDIHSLFRTIIQELNENPTVLLHLVNIYSVDSLLYHHSFNVTIMALMVGMKMKLDEKQLMDLGIGTLLHDIGKLSIPDEVLKKPGKLSPEEFELVKQHTTLGYRLLKEQGDISGVAAQIALQHHERFDGRGYPNGTFGKDQHLFGRIVAVCDVYEALTANRVYRKGHMPHQAFEYILGGGGTHFDPEIANVFVHTIAVYPIGSEVCLNNGHKGVVTAVDPSYPQRPTVRVLWTGQGELLEEPYEIDLTSELTCMIVDSNLIGISESLELVGIK